MQLKICLPHSRVGNEVESDMLTCFDGNNNIKEHLPYTSEGNIWIAAVQIEMFSLGNSSSIAFLSGLHASIQMNTENS